jgi:hypothetical protein
LDGRHIGVAEKFPHSSFCIPCNKEKLCTGCGVDAVDLNCLCTMTLAEKVAVCSLTKHQVAILVSVCDEPRDTSFQGVHEIRDETIAYEKGNGWWAGYSGIDGRTAHALIRAGMITTDHSITNSVTEYYKLTRLGRLAAIKDYEYRKELGVL